LKTACAGQSLDPAYILGAVYQDQEKTFSPLKKAPSIIRGSFFNDTLNRPLLGILPGFAGGVSCRQSTLKSSSKGLSAASRAAPIAAGAVTNGR
jgi:hypothetical protein